MGPAGPSAGMQISSLTLGQPIPNRRRKALSWTKLETPASAPVHFPR